MERDGDPIQSLVRFLWHISDKRQGREMKDAQYSFNRNLRKIIQTRGEKKIQKNSPDPKKDTGLHMGKPGSEKNEEDK